MTEITRELIYLAVDNARSANAVERVHQGTRDLRVGAGAPSTFKLTLVPALPSAPELNRRGELLDIDAARGSALGGRKPVECGLDLLQSAGLGLAGAHELSHGIVRTESGLTRDSARRELTLDQASPELHGRSGNAHHGADHTAQVFEQSSAQNNARASRRARRHAVLMKLSTAEIIQAVIDHTKWKERRLARWLGVSSNTPRNWMNGNGTRGDNIDKVTAKLAMSADQFRGKEDLPSDWLDRIDFSSDSQEIGDISVSYEEIEDLFRELNRVNNEALKQQNMLLAAFLTSLRRPAAPPPPRKSG